MKTKLISILSACLLGAAGAWAQSGSSLLISPDPENAALAGTSVAREANAYAVDNNAAAMSLSDRRFAVGASYSMWAPKTADNTIAGLGAYMRIGERLAVGISGKYLQDQAMTLTDDMGVSLGTFTPYDFNAAIGVSYKLILGLSAGVTAKVLSSTIGDGLSSTAFAADVSLAWRLGNISAGAMVGNLGSSLNYNGTSYCLPSFARIGGAYSIFGLTASVQADYLFSGAFAAGVGLEYAIMNIAFLRAGYHYGDDSLGLPSYASVGLGARFLGAELNAAYLLGGNLGNTLQVGLGFSF